MILNYPGWICHGLCVGLSFLGVNRKTFRHILTNDWKRVISKYDWKERHQLHLQLQSDLFLKAANHVIRGKFSGFYFENVLCLLQMIDIPTSYIISEFPFLLDWRGITSVEISRKLAKWFCKFIKCKEIFRSKLILSTVHAFLHA